MTIHGHKPGGYAPLSEWELVELMDRISDARTLPKGHRHQRMNALASDYGVSTRTIYRWANRTVITVNCGPYRALFAWRKDAQPYQVTPWERDA